MKTNSLKYVFLAAACFFLLGACKDKMPIFESEITWVNFNIATSTDSTKYYSFIYAENPNAETDTIWVEAIISGKPMNYDREIAIAQQNGNDENIEDAIPDVHYVSFANPDMKKRYILPANKFNVMIPIVVKRDESLSTADRVLQLEIVSSPDLEPGFTSKNRMKIFISNKYARPDNWNVQTNTDIATYSGELHEFLVNVTGEKWDNDYLTSLGYIIPEAYAPYPNFPTIIAYRNTNTGIYELQYIKFLVQQLKDKLVIENQKRVAEGLPPWNIVFR